MSLSLSCLTAFVLHQIWKGSRAPARSQPALLTHLTWGSWKWLYVKFLTSWLKVFGIYLETHTSFSTQPCPFQTFFFPWKAFYSVWQVVRTSPTWTTLGVFSVPAIPNMWEMARNETIASEPLGEGPSKLCWASLSGDCGACPSLRTAALHHIHRENQVICVIQLSFLIRERELSKCRKLHSLSTKISWSRLKNLWVF